MNKSLPVYRSAVGLNDKIDAVRVPYDPKTGTTSLSVANDIVFDLTGSASRRDGYALQDSGDYDSVFSCGDYGLCVEDGYLCLLAGGLSSPKQLVSLGSNDRVSYAMSFNGTQDVVYFVNGVMAGKVVDRAYAAWTVPAYVGIDSTESQVRRFETAIPAGHLIMIFNGRLYIAKDNVVYVSEPFAFSWFNITKAFVFESRVKMLRSVLAGVVVSTQSEILLLPGNGPEDFGRVRLCSGMAVEGTDVLMPGLGQKGDVLFFAVSGRGICSIDSGGSFANHTETFIDFPVSDFGAAYINNQNQYVVTTR